MSTSPSRNFSANASYLHNLSQGDSQPNDILNSDSVSGIYSEWLEHKRKDRNIQNLLERKRFKKRDEMRHLRGKIMRVLKDIFHINCGHVDYLCSRHQELDQFDAKKESKKKFFVKNRSEANLVTNPNPRMLFANHKYPKFPPTLHRTQDLTNLPKENVVLRLCQYLSPREISLIADDPLFYLCTSDGTPISPELVDHKFWYIQAGIGTDFSLIKRQQILTSNHKVSMYKKISQGDTDWCYLPAQRPAFYHAHNTANASENKEFLLEKKFQYFSEKNQHERVEWEKRWGEECMRRGLDREKCLEDLDKKNSKAEVVSQGMKDIVEWKKNEMREEELGKFESAFSNRRKLKELGELMGINNDIKNACKELVLKKYKSQKVVKGC
jgi:hypothetical protein